MLLALTVTRDCSEKKGKTPKFLTRINCPPRGSCSSAMYALPAFRSVVYNCCVHSKASRFVFKQSVMLLVTVVIEDQVSFCFVAVYNAARGQYLFSRLLNSSLLRLQTTLKARFDLYIDSQLAFTIILSVKINDTPRISNEKEKAIEYHRLSSNFWAIDG